MKKLLLILLISSNVNSQNLFDFQLQDSDVVWQKVYDYQGITLDQINRSLLSKIPKQNVRLLENSISFRINDDTIDYKSYGGVAMFTWIFIHYPVSYFVTIDVKENRYRVTCYDFTAKALNDTWLLAETGTQQDKKAFSTKTTVVKGMVYLNQYLTDKFSFSLAPISNNW